MKYQLVLQWSASALDDYDALIEIENILIANLSGECEVDGHDMGSDEMNIFILTDDPRKTFDSVKKILLSSPRWSGIRCAFHDLKESQFTVLWPETYQDFQVI